ncbi:chorismate-binding protein [Isobaculum melis]|uniref:Chorismate binding enzyme n=1 Tax=Isobaculum melis TaxID=142588 RepID=A0A1H9TNK9_9LACT|nr:chorismate-binding protein [Isobaculum melis]SER98712.1 chorismate binding enzyme [Isobaculum melis]
MKLFNKDKKGSKVPLLHTVVEEIGPLDLIAVHQKWAGKENLFFWRDEADAFQMVGFGDLKFYEHHRMSQPHYVQLIEKKVAEQTDRSYFDAMVYENGTCVKKQLWDESMKEELDAEALVFPDYIGAIRIHAQMFDAFNEPTKGDLFYDWPAEIDFIPNCYVAQNKEKTYLVTNRLYKDMKKLGMFQTELKWQQYRRELMRISELELKEDTFELKETTDMSYSTLKDKITAIQALIKQEKVNQLSLARNRHYYFNHDVDVSAVLQQLLWQHETGYVFAISHKKGTFLGHSNQSLVKESENCVSIAYDGMHASLQATITTDEERARMQQEQLDWLSDVLARFTDEPSIAMEETHTRFYGDLKKDASLLHLVSALHPLPRYGGLPKIDAVGILRGLEEESRGYYAAPIGWYTGSNGDFAVAKTSGIIKADEATLYSSISVSQHTEASAAYKVMDKALSQLEEAIFNSDKF